MPPFYSSASINTLNGNIDESKYHVFSWEYSYGSITHGGQSASGSETHVQSSN